MFGGGVCECLRREALRGCYMFDPDSTALRVVFVHDSLLRRTSPEQRGVVHAGAFWFGVRVISSRQVTAEIEFAAL